MFIPEYIKLRCACVRHIFSGVKLVMTVTAKTSLYCTHRHYVRSVTAHNGVAIFLSTYLILLNYYINSCSMTLKLEGEVINQFYYKHYRVLIRECPSFHHSGNNTTADDKHDQHQLSHPRHGTQ